MNISGDNYNDILKEQRGGRGPNKILPDENGYYQTTIRSKKKVYSCSEIYAERKTGLSDDKNKHYRFYPCYEDINDISTLEWWLIYY